MYKDILRSIPGIQLNRSSFSHLFNRNKPWQKIPTKWIALYEEYLKPFCTTYTEDISKCLQFAGETYEMIGDKERALECYQKAFDIRVDIKCQMNNKISERIRTLTIPSRTIRTMNNKNISLVKAIDKEFSGMYNPCENFFHCKLFLTCLE